MDRHTDILHTSLIFFSFFLKPLECAAMTYLNIPLLSLVENSVFLLPLCVTVFITFLFTSRLLAVIFCLFCFKVVRVSPDLVCKYGWICLILLISVYICLFLSLLYLKGAPSVCFLCRTCVCVCGSLYTVYSWGVSCSPCLYGPSAA